MFWSAAYGAYPEGFQEESAEIVAYALKSGITFVDTAQMYKTYSPIKQL